MNNLSNPVTDDRLQKIASWRETYGNGHNVMIPAEEAELIVSELLARREAAEQPVLYCVGGEALDVESVSTCRTVVDSWVEEWNGRGETYRTVPLFTAPPLPVVPDEITYEQACLEVTKLSPAEAYMKAWSARSIMLNHIFGTGNMVNYPGLPDGWVAVSERFPGVGDVVMTAINGCVSVGLMERSGAHYRYFTSVISGRELPATHWMPLPEAPKPPETENK